MTRTKQKLLVEKIVENSRRSKPKSHRQVIKEAGYSQRMADHPAEVIETRSFEQLLEQELPDGPLVKQLYKNVHSIGGHVSNEAIKIAFQVKGKLININKNIGDDLNHPISEIDNEIKSLESKLLDKLKSYNPEK